VYKDRNVVAQLVRRAERAGFKAIALTVDTPRLGRREADIKNRCYFTTLRVCSSLLPNAHVILDTHIFRGFMDFKPIYWPKSNSLKR